MKHRNVFLADTCPVIGPVGAALAACIVGLVCSASLS